MPTNSTSFLLSIQMKTSCRTFWRIFSIRAGNMATLRFFERGASLQIENLWVKCDDCGAARSLVHAFGEKAKDNIPACRGRHPHLDVYNENCDQPARAVLLGATNSWFPITLSVLAIPHTGNSLNQIVADGWTYFEDATSEDEVKIICKILKKSGQVLGIDKLDPKDLWEAISARKSGTAQTEVVGNDDIKRPEWAVLTHPNPPTDWPHFLSERVDAPATYSKLIPEVLLLKRLREVNALIGYTRVEAPEETDDPDERPPMADLCRGVPEWVPATEVHGEGIFLRFSESQVASWEKQASVQARDAMLRAGHAGWRNARQLDPNKGYPSIRYAMLHTFSHLLIRELALECGYNAASIRERIYANLEGESAMAGILLYTAAADSDGTLGGLVELGKPNNLGRLIQQALYRATACSSDPLCSEHNPEQDRSLHAASCHACGFVAETSCERGNRYLDRALLIPTFDSSDAAFFTETEASNG
jgi:hypothetical protein